MTNDFVTELDSSDIQGDMEITMVVHCSLCCEPHETVVGDMQSAKSMFEEARTDLDFNGWRMLDSNEFNAVGIACPSCIREEELFREEANGKD